METPLLTGADHEEDQARPSNNGGTGNEQDASTGNEQDVSIESEDDVRTEDSQAASIQKGQAASPREGQAANKDPTGKHAVPAKAKGNSSKTKKNISQVLLNLTLLTANARQLRTVLDGGTSHPYFCLVLVLISLSITLQIVAGALMAYVGKLDVDKDHDHAKCNKVNNAVAIFVLLISAFNAVIPVFGPQP